MPQTSAPSPRPQSAPQGAAARASKTSRPQAASRPQGPARRTSQRMDFAPRRGNVTPQPRPTTPAAAKAAASATKPTSRPAAKPSPRPVSRRPAVKPAPKPVSSRPAQTAPRPATPRRPALITSAREAMNAHARVLREAQLETQSITQPATQRSAHPATSSSMAPEQGIAAPTSPRSAHNLHHAPAPTAPERPRVTPMPTLPPPPPRPAAPVRAGTDPLVQRTRPLQRTTARPSAPQQQIRVSAPAPSHTKLASPTPTPSTLASSTSATDAAKLTRLKLPHLAAFSRAASADAKDLDGTQGAKDLEDTSLNNTRYALGERSPFFLQSVSVEKRPLSSGRPSARTTARKNVYPKKPTPKPEKAPKPELPTIIVPDSHRSKGPLIALIIFTILLGALVGAAAYLFFFQ